MARRRLLVTADDLGWSHGVNRGIIECHVNGIVTRASIMPNGAAFDDAVERARQTPSLAIGVHLNFYRGTPVSPLDRVPSLVGPDGTFPGAWKTTIRRLATGALQLDELEAELSAQVERVLAVGLVPICLNSDKHLHLWPSAFDVTCRVARRYGIPEIRVVRDPLQAKTIALGLHGLSVRNARVAKAMQLQVPDGTIGVAQRPLSDELLLRILRGATHGRTEMVVHPGYVDDEFRALQQTLANRFVGSRELEIPVLTGPDAHAAVERAGLELVQVL